MKVRWLKYCHAYIQTGDQTKSARIAGYKDGRNLRHYASKLHKRPEIQAQIAELVDQKYNLSKDDAEKLVFDEWQKSTKDTTKVRLLELWLDVKGYRKQPDTNINITNIGQDTLEAIRNKRLSKASSPTLLSDTQAQESIGS